MSRQVICEPVLTTKQVEDILQLYALCNAEDSTSYTFDPEDNFRKGDEVNTFGLYEGDRLIAALTIFAPTQREAEITALTLPGKRRSGCFSSLMRYALKEIQRRGIVSILLVCDAESEDGLGTISGMGAAYEYSEYLMAYRAGTPAVTRSGVAVSEAVPSERERLAYINHAAFSSDLSEARSIIDEFLHSTRRRLYTIRFNEDIVGMIGVYDESTREYLYGFCIEPKFQHMGIGSHALAEAVRTCSHGEKEITLEVQAGNRHALRVYERAGFAVQAEFRYYRMGMQV